MPVQQAPELKLGLPVRILDDAGEVMATNKITFVSPTVDDADADGAGQGHARRRPRPRSAPISSSARRSSGSTEPGLTRAAHGGHADQRPVLRLRRREGTASTAVARQTRVQLGAARRQRLRGAGRAEAGRAADRRRASRRSAMARRCMVGPPARRGGAPPAEGVVAMFADVFIRRPVLSTVCSLLIILAGAIAIPTLPIARYPDLAPPAVSVTAFYTGANAQAVESAVTTPLEQAINGVEGMTYMTSSSTNSGVSTITVTFDIGRDPGPGGRGRPEPRQPGARPHAGRSPHQRHHRDQGHGRVHGRHRVLLARQPLHRSSSATTSTSTSATRSSACPASATSSSSASASSRCGCGSIPTKLAAPRS